MLARPRFPSKRYARRVPWWIVRRLSWRLLGVGTAGSLAASAADNTALEDGAVAAVYQVPSSCPVRDDFVREVLKRSPSNAQSEALALVREGTIEIAVQGSTFRGWLRFQPGETREVVGDSCSEVVQALALVVALRAKQTSNQSGQPDGLPPKAPEPAATQEQSFASRDSRASSDRSTPPSTQHDSVPREVREPTSTTSPAHQASLSHVRAEPLKMRPTSPDDRADWTLGGGAIGAFGLAPMGLYGLNLFAEHRPRRSRPYTLVFGLDMTPHRTYFIQGESAEFQWLAGRIDGCVTGLTLNGRSRLSVCAEVVSGLVFVAGERSARIVHERTAHEAWLSSGPAARLRIGLPARLTLDFSAGLGFPFIRHETAFSTPTLNVYRTGYAAGFFSLQIGREFNGFDRTRTAIAHQ